MRSKAVAISLCMMAGVACSGTATEVHRGDENAGRAWAAAEQRRIDATIKVIEQSSCKRLTASENTFDSTTANVFARALVQRCEPPSKDLAGSDRDEAQKQIERAADLVFRIIPEETGQSRKEKVYSFLDDPQDRMLAKQLFSYFLGHKKRDWREGKEPLQDWAPYAGLYEQLAFTCDELGTLAPDTEVSLALWNSLQKTAHCTHKDATNPLKAALKGTSTSRAAACKQLAEDSLALESEMIEAVQTDYGENTYGSTGSVQAGPFVIPTGSALVSSKHPGRETCMATLAKVHGVRVMNVLVDSPSVTVTIVYFGHPKAIVVFTADKNGTPTRGYVASSLPLSVPSELSTMVEGALPKKKTVERLVAKPLNDKTARLDESGGFSKTDGPHQWSLVLPRNPLPDKIVVLVLDEDGTIRRSGG